MFIALLALFFLTAPATISGHGFTADTLVCMYDGTLLPISDLAKKSRIAGYTTSLESFADGHVKKMAHEMVSKTCIITTETQEIQASPTQWFLCETHNGHIIWKPAHIITCDDWLCTIYGPVPIINIEKQDGSTILYKITTKPDHTFLITEDGIIVHNTGGEIGAILLNTHYASVLTLETAALTPWGIALGCAAGACFVVYGVYRGIRWCIDRYKQYRARSKLRNPPQAIPRSKTNGKDIVDTDTGKPDDDDNKPVRRKYIGVAYHHFQSRGRKSPAPLNGQAALDVSVELNIQSGERIGTSCQQIVKLKRSLRQTFPTHIEEQYHGYVMTWEEIGKKPNGDALQNLLIECGLTTLKGIALR